MASTSPSLKEISKKILLDRLVKLGDMIGDGLADEPGGAWINKEYKSVLRQPGIIPKRKVNKAHIDGLMKSRVVSVSCKFCGGKLKQTRSGSMRASCVQCGAKFQLLKRK